MSQPPGQPAPPGQPGQPGWVRLTIQGNEMTSGLVTPTVLVNGWQVPSRYGVQDVAVHPGGVRLEMWTQWITRYGRASLDLDVASGQVVEVFYAAPWHQFAGGNLGLERQKRPGAGCLLVVGGLVAAVLLLVLLLALL